MTTPNIVILPIAYDTGYDNEILLEYVSRFVVSLNNPAFYAHMIQDEKTNTFIISTEFNLYYVFVKMLYIEDVYEDGKYVYANFKWLNDFLENINKLEIPLEFRSEIAIADIDPNDLSMKFDKVIFYKDFIPLIKNEDLNQWNNLINKYNIYIVEKFDDIFTNS